MLMAMYARPGTIAGAGPCIRLSHRLLSAAGLLFGGCSLFATGLLFSAGLLFVCFRFFAGFAIVASPLMRTLYVCAPLVAVRPPLLRLRGWRTRLRRPARLRGLCRCGLIRV